MRSIVQRIPPYRQEKKILSRNVKGWWFRSSKFRNNKTVIRIPESWFSVTSELCFIIVNAFKTISCVVNQQYLSILILQPVEV